MKQNAITVDPYVVSLADLLKDPVFTKLAEVIDKNHFQHFPVVRDAQAYITKTGMIFNSDGWHHPDGFLVGTMMYAPDRKGAKTFFGQRYQKLTLYPGTYEPIPFADRFEVSALYDERLAKPIAWEPYAEYKQVLPRDEFVAYIPNTKAYRLLVEDDEKQILQTIDQIGRDIGIGIAQIPVGLTGSPLLGQRLDLHDIDIQFAGNMQQNYSTARAIRDFVGQFPERRLFEGGKGWNIRYVDRDGKLVCCFFAYGNVRDAPLRDFSMEVVREDFMIEGIVCDDLHTMYLPTILEVVIDKRKSDQSVRLPDHLKVIVYHAASRGDCFNDDVVRASGSLVRVRTTKESYLALSIVERQGLVNLTPTWAGYYA